MSYTDVAINHKLTLFAECNWVEKRNRFEVMVPGVGEKAYGATKTEAMDMMYKILKNQAFKRPLLEDIEEHENYQAQAAPSRSSHQPVFNINVTNSGEISNVQNLNIAITQSTQQLQQCNPPLAEGLSMLARIITDQNQLPESKKIEALDYVDVITKEAEKPSPNRMLHRISNSISGIKDILSGVSAAQEIIKNLEPHIRGLILHLP